MLSAENRSYLQASSRMRRELLRSTAPSSALEIRRQKRAVSKTSLDFGVLSMDPVSFVSVIALFELLRARTSRTTLHAKPRLRALLMSCCSGSPPVASVMSIRSSACILQAA